MVAQIGEEIARLLGNPRTSRVGGDTSQVHPPAAQFYDEQHIQPLQEHRVDGEEFARQDAGGLPMEKRPPRRRSTLGCSVDAVSLRIELVDT